MAHDIDFRIQERIEKFGVDGKKILGIDIPVPYKPKDKYDEYGEMNRLRDQQRQQNLYNTDRMMNKQELEEKKSIEPTMPIMVKHSEVIMTA
jgi:rRNA maturation protein Nop10